eukprot:14772430-Alexandrium_andersonii.AAC.1
MALQNSPELSRALWSSPKLCGGSPELSGAVRRLVELSGALWDSVTERGRSQIGDCSGFSQCVIAANSRAVKRGDALTTVWRGEDVRSRSRSGYVAS